MKATGGEEAWERTRLGRRGSQLRRRERKDLRQGGVRDLRADSFSQEDVAVCAGVAEVTGDEDSNVTAAFS